MKPGKIILTALIACCAACNNTGNRETETSNKDTVVYDSTYIATTPIPLDGCYKMVFNLDTATMRLNVVDSFVTGDLSYHWHAKDHNDGSIKGVIRDSLIIADYTFRSEGMLSVRQVAFKIRDNTMIEGYGELDTRTDTVRFKDPNKLNFQFDRPFVKAPCGE
jgi:hypothetical protein